MHRHFVIIGAQRSGTTYLYKILDSHPEVFMAKPVKPEPKYFIDQANIINGYSAYYKRYFMSSNKYQLLGEKSTSYIEKVAAARAIKAVIPNCLIIVSLRDPIERAISNYQFTVNNGLESLSFENAIKCEEARSKHWRKLNISVNPYAYTERGHYVKYLPIWEQVFGKDNMIFIVFEKMVGDKEEISNLYKRIGVDGSYSSPHINEIVNPARSKGYNVMLNQNLKSRLDEIFMVSNKGLECKYGIDTSMWR
ncbi:sulfotransferase family protein [Desulfosediminicola sp.]|uniref:sulfotransferase family protein n=1 Tax=Desulfosediminicola sp. TaxID=2886825 RepID=UPI003AF26A48